MKKINLISAAVCGAGLWTTLTVNAAAYIDPSVMTYSLQAIGAVIIAVGAGIGIYGRKVKKKMADKLGIDENKNKEVENDSIVVDDDDDE